MRQKKHYFSRFTLIQLHAWGTVFLTSVALLLVKLGRTVSGEALPNDLFDVDATGSLRVVLWSVAALQIILTLLSSILAALRVRSDSFSGRQVWASLLSTLFGFAGVFFLFSLLDRKSGRDPFIVPDAWLNPPGQEDGYSNSVELFGNSSVATHYASID